MYRNGFNKCIVTCVFFTHPCVQKIIRVVFDGLMGKRFTESVDHTAEHKFSLVQNTKSSTKTKTKNKMSCLKLWFQDSQNFLKDQTDMTWETQAANELVFYHCCTQWFFASPYALWLLGTLVAPVGLQSHCNSENHNWHFHCREGLKSEMDRNVFCDSIYLRKVYLLMKGPTFLWATQLFSEWIWGNGGYLHWFF
jgi:hypothetical protein